MLTNVYQYPPTAIPGTRLLEATLDIVGVRLPDHLNPTRVWEITGLYLPIEGRALGGVRVRLIDQKGFITFCNQRDVEVLLGMGRPGAPIPWRHDHYVGPDHAEWFGLCCDDDDLQDDLQEQEMFIRGQLPGGILIQNLEMTRRVHLSETGDFEEVFLCVDDLDPETGLFPDTRFETIERRWSRVERSRTRWDRI